MKKIMFYCQYLAGMGHLVRSNEILRSLVKDFKVCFINGGQIIPGFEIPPSVEVINLPALRMENEKLVVVDDCQDLEEVKQRRTNKLIQVFEQFQPDCLITESFPFGKRSHSFELIPLLNHIKSSGYSTKVACSVRDLLMSKLHQCDRRTKIERSICKVIDNYYDMVIYHSDSKLLRLEESFFRVKDLNCEICYTGYVCQSPSGNSMTNERDISPIGQDKPIILASVGGGRYGYELLNSIVEVSPILALSIPHKIYAFTGHFMPEEDFLKLQESVVDKSNITIKRYTPNLIAYMEKADLSISLGGYNTTMNILKTGVRAMIFPSQSPQLEEQRIRAEKLEKREIIEVIHPIDLEPNHFAQKILSCLSKEKVKDIPKRFDLDGAQKTAEFLKALLNTEVVAA